MPPSLDDIQGSRDLIPIHVVRVIDGDTVVISHGGQRQTVRLSSVDTPETNHFDSNGHLISVGEPLGPPARRATERFFQTQSPEGLQFFWPGRTTDSYGRAVGYIFNGNRQLNYELIKDGYSPYVANPRYGGAGPWESDMIAAQQDAIRRTANGGAESVWDPDHFKNYVERHGQGAFGNNEWSAEALDLLPDGSAQLIKLPNNRKDREFTPRPLIQGDDRRYQSGQIKIGTIWLPLPPEAISLQTDNEIVTHRLLRSSGSLAERTGYSQTLISIQGKLDCDQLATYLQPVLAQFAICPFLPVRNIDVERQLFDKGLLYATSSAESEVAHGLVKKTQLEVDAIYREAQSAVDVEQSSLSPERFADLVGGYAGELRRQTKTRRGFTLDDAINESEANFGKKTDRWVEILEHEVIFKGHKQQDYNAMADPAFATPFDPKDSAYEAGKAERIQRFKQWSYRLATAHEALENAARDWTHPYDEVRMTDVWVALASFGAAPLVSSPNAFAFNLVLQIFNYLPYTTCMGFKGTAGGSVIQVDSPEESAAFSATWPTLLLDSGVDQSSRSLITFVRPIAGSWGNKSSVLRLVEHDPNAPAASMPYSPAGATFGPDLDNVSFNYAGDFVQMPIEGEKYPTLQWMGSGTATATITFQTEDLELLERLKDFDNSAALMARRYEKRGRLFYFVVEDAFLNAFGLSSCDISQLSMESTANPGSWRVTISLHGITPKTGELFRTERVADTRYPQPYSAAVSWCLNNPDKGELAGRIAKMLTDPPPLTRPDIGFAGGTSHFFVIPGTAMAVDTRPSIQEEKHIEETKNPNFLKEAPLCMEGRQILAKLSRDKKPSDFEGVKAADGFRDLMDHWEGAQKELITRARKFSGQNYDSGKSGSPYEGKSPDELVDIVNSINGLLSPIADEVARAAHNRNVEMPGPLKEIFAGANNALVSMGEYSSKNLYPDFPTITMGELQNAGMARQETYWNPDQWKVEPETPGYLVDPWFFLYVPALGGADGGPSEINPAIMAQAEALAYAPERRLQSDYLKATESYIDPHRKQADKGYFEGDIAKLTFGNAQDKQAIAKTAQELNYYEMAGVMDFMNVTTVAVHERDFIMKQTRQAIEASKSRWKGIAGALPTFWMAFIEKDANEWGLFDDFYNYQALESIYIVRSKREAMDVAYVTVSNLYGNLGGELASSAYKSASAGEEYHGLAEGSADENSSLNRGAFPLQPGTQVIIKIGYGNNINKLETVFTGQVAEIAEGSSMQLVLQGYGSELLEIIPPASNSHDKYIAHATAREVVELMLRMPKVNHFGRSPEIGLWERFFMTDPLFRLAPGDALHHQKVGKYMAMSNNQKDTDIDDVNIWLPDLKPDGVVACQTPSRKYPLFLTAGATPWQVIQDVLMDHPGLTAAVRPYDSRATLFMGNPEQDYFQSSRSLYTYNLRFKMAAGQLGADTVSDVPPAEKRPFRKYHLCRSGVNLIRNELEATKEFYNQVIMDWSKLDGKWNWLMPMDQWDSFEINSTSGMVSETPRNGIHGGVSDSGVSHHDGGEMEAPGILTLDPGIPRDEIKSLRVYKRNICNEDQALRYAISILDECVERAYKGSIWMRSDVDIWPGDIVMLYDDANQMYGPIEADEVMLHFDREVGYCYQIKPNCVVSVQNYATPQMLHSMQLFMTLGGHIGWDSTGKGQLPKGAKRGGSSRGYLDATSVLPSGDAPSTGLWGWIKSKLPSRAAEILEEQGQGENTQSREHAYIMLNNHPISVFPLLYQGRPWWPLNHRGGLLDSFGVTRALPGNSLANDAGKVGFFYALHNMGHIVNVFKGRYSNWKIDSLEQK